MEERVFAAINTLEARGKIPYTSAIVRESALPLEDVRPILHDLAEKSLLHREEVPVDGLDFGPRWCVRQPT
jgi:hypothetical protein